MEYICEHESKGHIPIFFWRKNNHHLSLYQAISIIIISVLYSRFLVAFFMCTTSLRGSAPPCFGISNRSPSALVFWSYVCLIPSCQVTWVLVNLAIREVVRKKSCYACTPLIFLLFALKSSLHLYSSRLLSVYFISEYVSGFSPVFVFWLSLTFSFLWLSVVHIHALIFLFSIHLIVILLLIRPGHWCSLYWNHW